MSATVNDTLHGQKEGKKVVQLRLALTDLGAIGSKKAQSLS